MGNYSARFGGGHLEKGRNAPRQVSTLQRSPLGEGDIALSTMSMGCTHVRLNFLWIEMGCIGVSWTLSLSRNAVMF